MTRYLTFALICSLLPTATRWDVVGLRHRRRSRQQLRGRLRLRQRIRLLQVQQQRLARPLQLRQRAPRASQLSWPWSYPYGRDESFRKRE